ncbi:MAG: DUF421 domain-containing protein [Anaerolineaceae bacterium]|nr:DUF421 domain-containing protein [Anaerolineaceae bacterium]
MDTKIVQDMFQLSLPILEKILRPLIIYLFLVFGLRLAGKRELASLNPLDLVVLLTISNTVQNAIIGDDNSVTGGIIGATALLLVNYVTLRLTYNHPKVEAALVGTPDVLIDQGKVKWEVLKREMISRHDLEIAANKQGLISLDRIERAEIEPDGAIFFEEKIPGQDEIHFEELIARLDRIEQSLAQLTRSSPSPQA